MRVVGLIKPGVDPHEFEPTPDDVKNVANADLVLFTGKGIEGYLSKLEEAAGGSARFINIGKSIPSLTMREGAGEVEDPHWWHSTENMKVATRVVAAAFEKADPAHASDYEKNSSATVASLTELERWIRVRMASIPHKQRKLVTSHDAFQYFARDFGFKIYSVAGVSTEDEPSSKKIADLINTIRSEGVKAVFFESIENPKVVAEITKETGAKVGGQLYADGLGDKETGAQIGGTLYSDGLGEKEASTYEAMMRHNVSTIIDGLK